MKLIEVDLLNKYHLSGVVGDAQVAAAEPTVSAVQACAILEVTWAQWKMLLWRGAHGDDRILNKMSVPKALMAEVGARDHGVCHRCSSDMSRLQTALKQLKRCDLAAWKALRQQMAAKGVAANKRVLWVAERVAPGLSAGSFRTVCLFCVYKNQPPVLRKSVWIPAPVEGALYSEVARFKLADIERLRAIRAANPRCVRHSGLAVAEGVPLPPRVSVVQPEPERSRGPFKLYLGRAVHNIYANWCRTRSRRYKEMYLAPAEDGQAWESFLEDTQAPGQETVATLCRAVRRIAGGEAKEQQVVSLLADGYSLVEVVRMLSLPKTVLRAFAKGGVR